MNSLQRCAGLGQTGWANFSGKLFSVEQCWPDPVILTEIRAAGYVRQARLDHQSNNLQRIVQFQEAKLWQKGQRQISLSKTPNPQCR